MKEKYTSLGLMSGTSGDGVDASIIISDGIDYFEEIKNKHFEYDSNIYKDIHSLHPAFLTPFLLLPGQLDNHLHQLQVK